MNTLEQQIEQFIEDKGYGYGNYSWGYGCQITSEDLRAFIKQLSETHTLVSNEPTEEYVIHYDERNNRKIYKAKLSASKGGNYG